MKYDKNQNKPCSVSGCGKQAICKGYCSRHYQQIRLRGNIITKSGGMFVSGVCKILGCGKKTQAKDLCSAHYRQERVKMAQSGKVLVNGEWVEASSDFAKIVKEIKLVNQGK